MDMKYLLYLFRKLRYFNLRMCDISELGDIGYYNLFRDIAKSSSGIISILRSFFFFFFWDECTDPRTRLFVLRFYGPVNPMESCRARSVLPNHTFTGQA